MQLLRRVSLYAMAAMVGCLLFAGMANAKPAHESGEINPEYGVFTPTTKQDQEFWEVHPQYDRYAPNVIAVLPMDNFSLEPEMESVLYTEVYQRLQSIGYRRVSVEAVQRVMEELGVQTPG